MRPFSLTALCAAPLATPVPRGATPDARGPARGPPPAGGSLGEKPRVFPSFPSGAGGPGALNADFFVSWGGAPRGRVRGGGSHYVTNYTVTDTAAVGAPSSRYQKFQTLPFIPVRLQL